MTTHILSAETGDDTQLVAQSLAGSRDAFGLIVTRYQSLVCALAFSATGSVSRSEDLAQETFVTAWQQLRSLRDPAKLRAWLCGVARNIINADRRRQGREPAHQAVPLDDLELAAVEPAPLAQAISNEEVALMWREVGQLPEIYREPLVLFYREHQSAAHVAAALELSEDVVMQRLSRGRKLLHERMLAFVETVLDRTNPGKGFVLSVNAALPLLAVGGQGAGLASAKGMALKGGGGLFAFALPFVGMLAALGISWSSVRQAPNATERRFAKIWNIVLWSSIGALLLGLRGVAALAEKRHWDVRAVLKADVAVWFGYLLILVTLLVVFYRRTVTGFQRQADAGVAIPPGKSPTALVIATYVATTGWIIGLAWLMGDGGVAGLIALVTVGLATWNLRQMPRLSAAAAHHLLTVSHAGLCGVLLLVVNLRVDRWLAPMYQVSVDDMHRLLPMTVIHLLTVVLVGWAGALLLLTRRTR